MTEAEIRDFFLKAISSYGLKHAKKELSIGGLRIDIFAIDAKHVPYIIEFKKNKDRHIVGQAAQYLSLIPTYKAQVEKALNFYDIDWPALKVLCVAPDFLARDHEAVGYDPLKGKVHFYKFRVIQNSRKKVFSLNLEYKGPEATGPLILPTPIIDNQDVRALANEFCKIEQKEARREYYSTKLLPLLEDICEGLTDFERYNLYPHISYWNHSFEIRLGTDKRKRHRASLDIFFSEDILTGFDLTHSVDEAQILVKKLQTQSIKNSFIDATLKLKEYVIWLPNTGITSFIPIEELNEKGLALLLSAYNPIKSRDSYFRLLRGYDKDTFKKKDAIQVFTEELKVFEYFFEILKDN